jgi:hypothetical protein
MTPIRTSSSFINISGWMRATAHAFARFGLPIVLVHRNVHEGVVARRAWPRAGRRSLAADASPASSPSRYDRNNSRNHARFQHQQSVRSVERGITNRASVVSQLRGTTTRLRGGQRGRTDGYHRNEPMRSYFGHVDVEFFGRGLLLGHMYASISKQAWVRSPTIR